MMNNTEMIRHRSSLLREEYREYRHASGLTVLIFPKNLSSTYALLGTKYGSIHNCFRSDPKNEWTCVPDGIAHFLEHKLFTNEDGSDSFERFSDYGADANAYTSEGKTCYLFSCTDRFEESLRELLQFVTHPYFTKESVQSEIGIISEEIRMYDDNPSDRCFYGMLEGMYKNHSIRRNICGSVRSISEITPELLYTCYRAFYRPDNMALTVCGNVNDQTVLRIIDEILPATAPSTPFPFTENENEKELPSAFLSYREQRMQVSKPLFNIGFKDTKIPEEGEDRQRKDAAMAILNEMLFSRAGELYNQMVEEEMISPALSYGYTISASAAYNSLAGEADDPQAVLARVLDYLERVSKEGLSKEDFLRGKRVMYAEFVKAFDSTDSIANNLFAFFCEDSDLLL
ncbi:MAG: insulinase family protein, partial [Clostridia bacterium]|nr:insulinase family protein [Clostridia bacterium]